MAKKRIIGFADEESFRRVRDATRRVRSTPRVGAQRRRQVPVVGADSAVVEGILDGPLAPATNALTSPGTATLLTYRRNDSGDVEATGDSVTVTNRMTELDTIAAGTWLIARRMNGEWRPVAADCGVTNLGE